MEVLSPYLDLKLHLFRGDRHQDPTDYDFFVGHDVIYSDRVPAIHKKRSILEPSIWNKPHGINTYKVSHFLCDATITTNTFLIKNRSSSACVSPCLALQTNFCR